MAASHDGSQLAIGYPNAATGAGIVSIYSAGTWRKEFDVTSIPVVIPYSPDQIHLLVSPQRMAPYLGQCDGDPDRALRLYEWSSRMSAAA